MGNATGKQNLAEVTTGKQYEDREGEQDTNGWTTDGKKTNGTSTTRIPKAGMTRKDATMDTNVIRNFLFCSRK